MLQRDKFVVEKFLLLSFELNCFQYISKYNASTLQVSFEEAKQKN